MVFEPTANAFIARIVGNDAKESVRLGTRQKSQPSQPLYNIRSNQGG
jgi:hypothetical protein